MRICKIRKKYCIDDKVQVMLSNAPKQIIISKDGYLYLRDDKIDIHKYLNDPIRKKMPYKNKPSSKEHATHLFEYDKVYVKFTKYREMAPYDLYFTHKFSLTFLYFMRAEDGEAFMAEIDLEDFEAEEEKTRIFTKNELEKFLYNLENEDAKCIFEYYHGIQYALHNKESFSIKKESFLNISDEGIIKKYNNENRPLFPTHINLGYLCEDTKRIKEEDDESWKITNIDEIKEFDLTKDGLLDKSSLILLTIKGDIIYVYDISIIFKKKDCFELKSQLRRIRLTYEDVIPYAKVPEEYPPEPEF